jgi:hypothetical protein
VDCQIGKLGVKEHVLYADFETRIFSTEARGSSGVTVRIQAKCVSAEVAGGTMDDPNKNLQVVIVL